MQYPYKSQWGADAAKSRNDCGPAHVASILEAHGIKRTIDSIASAIDTADDGTTADDLAKVLRANGINAQVWTGTGYPRLPAICLVKYSGFDRSSVQDVKYTGWHWVMLHSLNNLTAVVHDPDYWGERINEGAYKRYSRAEFDRAFIPYGASKIAVVWPEPKEDAPVTTTYKVVDAAGVEVGTLTLNGTGTPPTPQPLDGWVISWYANRSAALSLDAQPLHVTTDANANLLYATWPTLAGIGPENFSLRAVKRYTATAAGTLKVHTATDDGVIVAVDGARVVDWWKDNDNSAHDGTVHLAAGDHNIVVYYYQGGGGAHLRADFEFTPDAVVDPDPPTPVRNPTFTATPPTITAGQSSTLAWSNTNGASGIFLDGAGVSGPSGNKVVTPSVSQTYTLRVQYPEIAITRTAAVTVTPATDPLPTTARRGIGVHLMFGREKAEEARNLGLRDAVCMNDWDTARWLCDAMGKTDAFDGNGTVMFRQYINYFPSSVDQAMGYMHAGEDKRIVRIITNESEFLAEGNSAEGVLKHAALDVAVAREMAKHGEHVALASFAVGNPDVRKPEICAALFNGYAAWWNTGAKAAGVRAVWDQHEYSPGPLTIYDPWEGDDTFQLPNVPGAPGASRVVHVYNTDWWETRCKFLFELCGFSLASNGVLVSSECGVDVYGKGGFIGNGQGAADVVKWARAYQAAYARPVRDWYGNVKPMPKESGCIFQGADASNDKGHWGSYYIGGMFDVISQLWK